MFFKLSKKIQSKEEEEAQETLRKCHQDEMNEERSYNFKCSISVSKKLCDGRLPDYLIL